MIRKQIFPSLIALCLLLASATASAQNLTPVGSLKLEAKIISSVYVDGVFAKLVRPGGIVLLDKIPVGLHVIEAESGGGKVAFQRTVEVLQGKATEVSIAEDPSLAAASYYNQEDFTKNYKSPLLSLKKERQELIASIKKQIEAEQFDAARAALITWVGEDKTNAVANYYLGYLLMRDALDEDEPAAKAQKLEQAKGYFQYGISKNKPFAYSYAGMGLYHALRRETAQMLQTVYTAEALDGNDLNLIIAIAEAGSVSRSRSGQNNAIRLLTKATAIAPSNPALFTQLGVIYMDQGVDELPLNQFEQAMQADAAYVPAYYRMGQYYVGQKKYAEGGKSLLKAVELDPKFAPAYAELGELYYRAKQYEKGKEAYQQYVGLRGSDLSARYRYTIFLYLSQDYTTAVAEIQTVLKDTTTNVLLRLLTYAATEKKDYTLARQTLDQYLGRIKPEEMIAKDYEYRGKILAAEGKKEEGIADILHCVELDPSRTDLYTDVVKVYLTDKNYLKAAEVQERLVKLEPGINNMMTLGNLYKFGKEDTKALAVYDTVTKRFPKVINGWYEAASILWLKFDQKDPENPTYTAKPYFDKVIELGEAEAEKSKTTTTFLAKAYYYQGVYVYFKENDRAKAVEFADKSLALDPTFTLAQDLKAEASKGLPAGGK